MRHCKSGRKFGRNSSQRKALLSSLLTSLIIHESIETTEAKAKELKGKMDKIITRAKRMKSDMLVFRNLEADLPKIAIEKVKSVLLKRLNDRVSGYTRLIKISPRKSDTAKMAIIEFVDFRENKVSDKNDKKKSSSDSKE